jgi:hypothetical protein
MTDILDLLILVYMTLKDTVSKILSREVTNEEAKNFADIEYGVLCAYIRSEAIKKILNKN